MIGDTEMIDIVGYVENFLEVINECGANCNNRLLKVKLKISVGSNTIHSPALIL
jgi:hypothetical protein